MARPTNPTSTKSQIHPRFQYLTDMCLLVVHFFYHLKKMTEIFLMIKSLAKMGETVNLKNMGSPIHPRWKSLPNMILMVTHLFYYPINTGTSYGSVLLH